MDFLKSLAAFGVVEVTTATALGISFHQYANSFVKYVILPLLKNFVDLNELKIGSVCIGKFIKESIIFWFSVLVAIYLLNVYLKYATGKQEVADKANAKKKKDLILKELGIDKKRLMYAMV